MCQTGRRFDQDAASPAAGLGFVGILQWQPPGKAPRLQSYSSGARTSSQPYAMHASGSSCSCNSDRGCCQDCHCSKQGYEHLPVPRLRHQQPPPPLYQNLQQQQQHQQVSCITTLQQTTTTQQVQQLPTATSSISNYSYGNCLMPTTATSSTYVSNIAPEQPMITMHHCHSHCNGHGSNMQHCGNISTAPAAPAIYNNSPAQPMIFVPLMLPMQQQHQHQQQQHQQQKHLQLQPPLPPAEDCKPLLQAKNVPPPPQPPPLLSHFQSLLQPPPLPPPPLMPQPEVACPLPSRAPATPPLPVTHNVQSLKSAAASAVNVYQRNGKLPRSLPALRAMEMALRTNSFATPPRPSARPEGSALLDMEDSDEEMEYMPPLHTLSRRKLKLNLDTISMPMPPAAQIPTYN
ncbi:bromodomain-containing protein 4-like [Drosophila rhopaloa]|uniref:Bromodomain-containing protein 4-like n=1 Tax=Drosophila rhopaloa TaxID=1041015 RepID=A0A6P4F6S2_DRORH|nr:bromodomain-containing protein 4-like [Drosophila rhopaloa]